MAKGFNILIIDDDFANQHLLRSILESEGYGVIIADGGKKALEIIEKTGDLRLILLDLMMPEFDGYQFLDSLNDSNKSDVPVIVVSAKTDSGSIQRALDKGAYDYLSKPFNIQDILNKIMSALTN